MGSCPQCKVRDIASGQGLCIVCCQKINQPTDDLRQPLSKPVVASTTTCDTVDEAPKHDQNKLRFDLLMPGPLRQVVAVLTFGAKKYEANSYRKGINWSRYVGATLRHVTAWFGGERNDPESGLHHLAHAICCLLFLLDFEDTRTEFDDRPSEKPFTFGAEKYDKERGFKP